MGRLSSPANRSRSNVLPGWSNASPPFDLALRASGRQNGIWRLERRCALRELPRVRPGTTVMLPPQKQPRPGRPARLECGVRRSDQATKPSCSNGSRAQAWIASPVLSRHWRIRAANMASPRSSNSASLLEWRICCGSSRIAVFILLQLRSLVQPIQLESATSRWKVLRASLRALSRELNLAVRNLEVPTRAQAAVAARQVRNASSRRTRSVRREVRWRWTLKVLRTTA